MSFDYKSIYVNMATPGATYPQGEAINESAPGSLDGTPFERRWMNDLLGMWARILTLTSIVPSGSGDNATYKNSQYVQGLAEMLLPKAITHKDDITVPSVANAYKVQQNGSTPEVSKPVDQMLVTWIVPGGIDNTGASTFQVDGTGAAEALVLPDGTALSGGEVTAGLQRVKYNAGLSRWEIQTFQGDFPSKWKKDLFLSNEGGDLDHDISFATGECKSSDGLQNIFNFSDIVKQIDANWVAGTNAGGMANAAGPVAADTWYHAFIIAKADGTVDFGFDTDFAATNLLAVATDFIKYRWIGGVLTDASANILPFLQVDDWSWFFVSSILDEDSTELADGVYQKPCSVPPDLKSICHGNTYAQHDGGGATIELYFTDPDLGTGGGGADFATARTSVFAQDAGGDARDGASVDVVTDDTQQYQIGVFSDAATDLDEYRFATRGYTALNQ